VVLITAMTAVYLFSAFYHFPGSVDTPSNYSDIGFIWDWNRLGVDPVKVPYLDYNLEYPPSLA